MADKVLFVTHPQRQCGVYEFGKKIFEALKQSENLSFIHLECNTLDELRKGISSTNPDFILYNYHPSVMPWLCTKLSKGVYINHINSISIPQVGIIHEVTQEVADTATAYRNKFVLGASHKKINSLFDFYIAADPTLLLKNPYVFKTGRLIPTLQYQMEPPSETIIGCFGFATPNKGFERMVSRVVEEFEEAVININMPFAFFGDENGEQAKAVSEKCRQIVAGTRIKLNISHDYLSDSDLQRMLSSCSMIVLLYEDKQGRGISSALDIAMAVNRPVAVSDSPMFRHLLKAVPGCNADLYTLKEILQGGNAGIHTLVKEWDTANLIWEYERIFKSIENKLRNPYQVKMGIIRTVKSFFNRLLTKPGKSFTWLGNTRAAHDDNMSIDPAATYQPVVLNKNDRFNRILDDSARKVYAPAIERLLSLVPATMAKKIARANVQQAFIFDTVYRHLKNYSNPKMLCVGSYEDTASMSLQKMGHHVEEIDPMINYFLQEYVSKPTTKKGTYDIIFSTSVIEHDPDDKSFIESIRELLAPGGMAVITCDYKDGWEPGQPKPEVDARFYVKKDLEQRLLSYLPDCELIDQPNWECDEPDFVFMDTYQYTFATFTFRKNR